MQIASRTLYTLVLAKLTITKTETLLKCCIVLLPSSAMDEAPALCDRSTDLAKNPVQRIPLNS